MVLLAIMIYRMMVKLLCCSFGATIEAGPATIDVNSFYAINLLMVMMKSELGLPLKLMGILPLFNWERMFFASENALVTYSPYYQNGLFIYGINAIHDGLDLYWDRNLYDRHKDKLLLVLSVQSVFL